LLFFSPVSRASKDALDGLDLKIREEELVNLCGRNGRSIVVTNEVAELMQDDVLLMQRRCRLLEKDEVRSGKGNPETPRARGARDRA
jgi:hypothetical protein